MKKFDVHNWNYKRRLMEQEDPRRPKDIEFDNAQAMSRLTPDDKDKLGKIQQMMQNERKPDEISLSYTDPGFRFYGMYLHKDGKRFAKINFEDRATKYLQGLGTTTEIPRMYDTDTLDKIKQEIEALGIEGDYSAAMDVS